MLTDKEVHHIAKLARIGLTEAEVEKFKKELSSVLGYIDSLKTVDTSSVDPLYQVTGLVNTFRADEPADSSVLDEHSKELLLSQAPMREEDFVKVKSVLKK